MNKIFGKVKTRVGNVLLPVVATLLGLAILATSVTTYVINSSAIVYKKKPTANYSEARHILYVASQYFSESLNNGGSASESKTELKSIFPGLEITITTSSDKSVYNLYYPYKIKDDGTIENYLRVQIKMQDSDEEDNNKGDSGINNTLFGEEPKISEIYNIGNMATLYMAESNYIPSRKWSSGEISLVESDIDNFDEAITYAGKSGSLLVDSVGIVTMQSLKDSKTNLSSSEVNGGTWENGVYLHIGDKYYYNENGNYYDVSKWEVIFETGDIGGNYYWTTSTPDTFDNATGTWTYKTTYNKTRLYRQVYSIEMLTEALSIEVYGGREVNSLKYNYAPETDMHTLTYKYWDEMNNEFVSKATSYSSSSLGDLLEAYIYDKYYYIQVINEYISDNWETIKNNSEFINYFNSVMTTAIRNDKWTVSVLGITWDEDGTSLSLSAINPSYNYSSNTLTLNCTFTYKYPGFLTGWKTYTGNKVLNFTSLEVYDALKKIGYPLPATYDSLDNDFIQKAYFYTYPCSSSDPISNFAMTKNSDGTYTPSYSIVHQWYTETPWLASLSATQYKAMIDNYNNNDSSHTKLVFIEGISQEELIETLDYMYINETKLGDLVGTDSSDATFDGYKQQALSSAIAYYFLENCGVIDIKTVESVMVRTSAIKGTLDNSTGMGGNLYYSNIDLIVNGVQQSRSYFEQNYLATTFKFVTWNVNEGALPVYNEKTQQYEYLPAILFNDSTNIRSEALPTTTVENINRNFVDGYGTQFVSADREDYLVETSDPISSSTVITQNTYSKGNAKNSSSSTPMNIVIRNKATLYIDGNLTLTGNDSLTMGEGSMLYVNGSITVYYVKGIAGNIFAALGWTSLDDYFKENGVNIDCDGATIICDGDFNYTGIKYEQPSDGIVTGFYQNSTEDLQSGLNTQHKAKETHKTIEPKSIISGIFIVNGDVNFFSQQINADGRNYTVYSNPLINGTFYVDGLFNMKGLWTSGLYDMCRPNFIFARAIVQPDVAIGTVYNEGLAGLIKTAFGVEDGGQWCNTYGYLFMICEDAIDFSELNFAAVNIFTPYSVLVGALESNAVAQWDFTEFVSKDNMGIYTEEEIDTWGLCSILRNGMKQAFSDIGNGNASVVDELEGNDF